MSEPLPQLLAGRRGAIVGISGENSLGWHAARMFQRMGAEVAVTYRPQRREAAGPLADAAGFVHAALEATDPPSIRGAFEEIGARFGRLDFLVHTLVHVPAGVLARPLLELEPQVFHEVLEIGARSLVALCREALPLLERSPSARVATLSSACGSRMTPNYHVAGIAKAALESTVLYLAQELGPRGILVNAVSPSLVATDGACAAVGPRAAEAMTATLARRAATRRAADAEDVASALAYLCSPLAREVTGTVLPVDGGFSRIYC